jgi:hypothetical protein
MLGRCFSPFARLPDSPVICRAPYPHQRSPQSTYPEHGVLTRPNLASPARPATSSASARLCRAARFLISVDVASVPKKLREAFRAFQASPFDPNLAHPGPTHLPGDRHNPDSAPSGCGLGGVRISHSCDGRFEATPTAAGRRSTFAPREDPRILPQCCVRMSVDPIGKRAGWRPVKVSLGPPRNRIWRRTWAAGARN